MPRSRFDQTAIVVFFHASPTPSDWNPTLQILREVREKLVSTVAVGSRSRGKSIASRPSRQRSDAHCSSTWRKVSPLIASLMRSYYARALIGDRVDSGPRDHRRSARIQRSSRRHASCKTETVWELSPTWRKYGDILRLNRGAHYIISLATSGTRATSAYGACGPKYPPPFSQFK